MLANASWAPLEPDGLGTPMGLSKREQVYLAQKLQHPAQKDAEFSADVKNALSKCCELSPAEVDSFRAGVLKKITEYAASSAYDRQTTELLGEVHASLRPLVGKINLGLVEWILEELQRSGNRFEDEGFLRDLCAGFAQTGVCYHNADTQVARFERPK